MSKQLLKSVLVLSMFVVTITWIPSLPISNDRGSNGGVDRNSSPISRDQSEIIPIPNSDLEKHTTFNIADDAPADGVLNPVTVEQSGYAASGNISARTDSFENLGYDLPLDVAHDWKADVAEVSVWNLEKLYVINGTFDDGYPGYTVAPNGSLTYYPLGWSAISYSGDPGQFQQVSYEQSGENFVTVQNAAKLTNLGQHQYTHYADTNITWLQIIENVPYTENFTLSFDYLLLQGPLSPTFSGSYSLKVFVDDVVITSIDLPTLSSRGQWISTGQIPVDLVSPSQFMTFKIGLVIDSQFMVDADEDYDGDGSPDGAINTQFITVYLDDVLFVKETPPTAEQVQLEFTTGDDIESLTGSMGTYYASIPNASYWITTPVSVALTANTSVSFDYKTRLYVHRFTDSNWRTDISSPGVAYDVGHGLSSDLTFYSYVGYLGGYEDPEMTIVFPSDWENLTVSDPFLTDLTGTCTIGTGFVTVPTSIIDRLGWWEIKLESPNYAKSIKSQIFDGGWSDKGEFRIDNTTRADITIGTDTQILGSLIDVNVTWYKPSYLIWVTELVSGGSSGQIYSSSQVFASGSSPAGEWWVEVYWTNGTEVAYDRAQFAIIHTANLIAEPTEITTDTGLTIKGIVRYTDGDTGDYILDTSATIVANWSGSTVPLVAISAQNWWEANFDTSITGEGEFVIVVNASRPYYDDISCQILVHSIKVTRLVSPDAPWTSADWGDEILLTFNFQSYDYGSETWVPVINETDVSANVNWTTGYWSVSEDITPGVYVMSLDTSAADAETWLLNVTFSKPNHQSKIILLTLIVSPATSSLSVFQGISAQVDLDEPFPLKLRYLDNENAPITSASIVVDSVSPTTGLDRTMVTEVGGEPGNYSITLTPRNAGVFTIRFLASKINSENATTVFVLVVNDVATGLIIPGSGSVEIGLTDVYNTTFRFQMENGTGIENAQINITYTGVTTVALTWDVEEYGLGDYSVEFSSTSSGTYLITIAAFKQYYQSASNAFFLIVRQISTSITCENGTADLVSFGNDYLMVVSYTNGTGHGLEDANVTIESVVSDSTLIWENATQVPGSPGFYAFLLTPQAADTFTILVQAELDNHQTQFVLFTLTATSIATSFTVQNTSTTIALDQEFTVTLYFKDETSTGVVDAIVSVQNPPAGVSFSQVSNLTNGYYQMTIYPLEVGTFDIVFKASKDGYQNGYASFTLGAIRVPTSLRTASGLSSDTMMFTEEYELTVLFERIDTGFNITAANITIQAVPTTGFSWSFEETSDGYNVTFVPERVGRWTLTITAQLEGHSSSSIEFILTVDPVQVRVEILSTLLVVEGTDFDVTAQVTTLGTNIPVTDALVSFRLTPIGASGAGDFIELDEIGTDGVYSISYIIPLYLETTQYTLEIKFEKDNYVLPGEIFEQSFVKENDQVLRMTPIITGGSAIVIALIALIAAVQINSRRKKSQMAIDLVNKRRFDDADNIIGIIVMHKKSGIPIYSKIVKGGFEEGIVAAFISAVTHFRQEFEMFDEEAMRVIPISDIIRAVQTRNLICAFVTVRSASLDHNRKMEAYAMQVGTYLDDLYDESKPPSVLDAKIAEMLDYIYDTTMDGSLIKFYKIAIPEKFPRRFRYLEELMHAEDMKHCSKPTLLSRGIVRFGITEARGCTLVQEAIEKKLILPCEEDETLVSEIDFAEYLLENETKDKSSKS